ncbi:nucleotidyltransferase family protein [Bifidobacterium parmae]|uniref:Nucleotidyltransferase family protein n=1 Tax=Bifidobacterium parmae TaxID=361854 RepID=A0A2N5J0J9_9BIFI|nr:nucleotidyltransferase family protein [Bifidobacterium parmae]PLS27711.1 hypothetical protein Uis4E_1397 [Bifidobacterium parmae]
MATMKELTAFDPDAGLYLCHLIACALRGMRSADDALPGSVAWGDVFALAKLNGVEAIAWMGLPEHPARPIDRKTAEAWRRASDMTLFRQLQFDAEREEIGSRLVAAGISFLALKGASMSAYYPAPGMRSMSDNDILYGRIEPLAGGGGYAARDGRRAERDMRAIMEGLGYTVREEAHGEVDFMRPPFLSFEMFQEIARPDSEHYGYYANPWRRTGPRDQAAFAAGSAGEMIWPIEDEYLFHLVHMFKHWEHGGGCGIRFVVDAYVFDAAMRGRGAGAVDGAYVRRELARLGLTDFERCVRALAMVVFGDRSAAGTLTMDDLPDTDDAAFLRSLLTCGIYGNIGFKVAHDVERSVARGGGERGGRLRYLWSRVFPSRELLVSAYPWVEGRPWLVPLMPMYRLVRGLALHRRKIAAELRALFRR